MSTLRAVLLVFIAGTLAAAQDHPSKASPFDALRWSRGSPEVLVGDTWYAPLAIDGLGCDEILAACRERWGAADVPKRFGEDLMEAMALCGVTPTERVTLRLEALDGAGDVVELTDVPNTRDKRQAIRAGELPAPLTLPRAAARRDLEAFVANLEERFAYLHLRDVDVAGDVSALSAALPETVDVAVLQRDLHRILMRCGDGHARVRGARGSAEPIAGHLPVLLEDTRAGVVAVLPDRSAFLDPAHPIVTALGGEPLAAWIDAVRPDIAAGSEQYVRRLALRRLREVPASRIADGASTLVVTLASLDGSETVVRDVALSSVPASSGDWPLRASTILDGDVGYLRITSMDDEAVRLVHDAMRAFRDTRGLIVDVRDNGGGSRAALLALGGYLVADDAPAWVGNVAAYRLAPAFDRDHLEARFMHRADWPGWSDDARAAIDAVAASFTPEWEPVGEFSAWHHLVVDRTGHAGEYAYEQPVVVLADAGCFSATDIFLGALELHPRVTLVGSASGGGSARSQRFGLPESRLEVTCASMASFRPDGRLYDGRGIEVDVEVLPEPGDRLIGGGDAVLDTALELLR